MFLGSCPFCSLAFASAGEVVWHVHDEHHWLTEEEQLNVEVVQAVSDELNWANFSELQSTVDDVAISLLVPTTPGRERPASAQLAWHAWQKLPTTGWRKNCTRQLFGK